MALFGFGGGMVEPVGQVALPISLGTYPLQKTRMVLEEFEIKEDRMKRYVSVIEGMVKNFTFFKLEQIPREKNVKADHLAKIASSANNCCTRKITILFEGSSSIEMEVLEIDDGDDWRFSIFQYLSKTRLPCNKRKAARVQARAMRFCIVGDLLYKRTFEGPMLRCLSEEEGRYVLREIHEGACGAHGESRALARKTTRAGYFWPKIKEEAEILVKTCEKCQKHSSLIHHHRAAGVMSSPHPFSKWGIDIVGPFPVATGQRKFLIVVVDYFSKWVEAEPVAKIAEQNMIDFIWKNVISRYGWPRDLVSDNGTQFQGRKIRSWLEGMKVRQHFTAVAHP
ncbi:hypothetical protein DH2020_035422 [Rehmannia glutinosa]|uniref:Integrase catalytic domain-containing protein n=1 Tax=Rehmannia glutinosa TaxID=99300 RepID=A0ABR0V8D2_REHGL